MKKPLKIVAAALGAIVLSAVLFLTWASVSTTRAMARTFEVHAATVPVPYPLDHDVEGAAPRSPEDASALAHTRAIERGRHLLEARYACRDCHGDDLGGGVMVDAFPLGTILGPNLTTGEGSVTLEYTPEDWERIVRHGVRADGRPAMMPSGDFAEMSDQELSDLIAYIRSLPPVDAHVPAPTLGPVGKVLVATGQLPFAADRLAGRTDHRALPPVAEVSEAFGAHISAVCTGCHGRDLSGGPIAGGDPSWLPAANLTFHAEGLAGWSQDDFVRVMREGVRPDGTEIRTPMTLALPVTQRMTDVELGALWAYLGSLEPRPTGG